MNEQEVAESIRTLEFYKTQLEGFDQQFNFLGTTLKEHTQAKETLEGYKDLKDGQETLIPIGAGSFLFGKVSDPARALVGIGADMVVETDMDSAVKKMDERICEIEDAMKNLSEKYQEVAQKASELSAKIQGAYHEH
jgi:prefoldin alpha subunit